MNLESVVKTLNVIVKVSKSAVEQFLRHSDPKFPPDIQPFAPPDHFIQRLFPARLWAILFPTAAGTLLFCGVFARVGFLFLHRAFAPSPTKPHRP